MFPCFQRHRTTTTAPFGQSLHRFGRCVASVRAPLRTMAATVALAALAQPTAFAAEAADELPFQVATIHIPDMPRTCERLQTGPLGKALMADELAATRGMLAGFSSMAVAQIQQQDLWATLQQIHSVDIRVGLAETAGGDEPVAVYARVVAPALIEGVWQAVGKNGEAVEVNGFTGALQMGPRQTLAKTEDALFVFFNTAPEQLPILVATDDQADIEVNYTPGGLSDHPILAAAEEGLQEVLASMQKPSVIRATFGEHGANLYAAVPDDGTMVPFDHNIAGLLPTTGGTMHASAFGINAAALLSALEPVLDEKQRQELDGLLIEHIGVNFEHALKALSGTWGIAADFGTVSTVGVHSRSEAMDAIMQTIAPRFLTRLPKEGEIAFVRVPLDLRQNDKDIPPGFGVAVGLHADAWIIGLNSVTVEAMATGSPGKPFANTPIAGRIAKDHAYAGFTNVQHLFGAYLPVLMGMIAGQVPMPNGDEALQFFGHHVAKSIRHSEFIITKKDSQLIIESQGPMAGIASSSIANTGPFGLGVVAGLVLPAVTQMRERGNRLQSGNNLRQLGFMIIMAQDEFKQGAPKSLEHLQELYPNDVTPDLFKVPGWQPGPDEISYLYLRPNGMAGHKTPLIIENPAARDGEAMIVVYGDGHFEAHEGDPDSIDALWQEAKQKAQSPEAQADGLDPKGWTDWYERVQNL